LARKGNREFILEFSGLHHYHLKEGRKPKYSKKTTDSLFIRLLIPVSWFVAASCKVQGSSIKTADGRIFSLPCDPQPHHLKGCRSVLAADCSSDFSFQVNLLPNATANVSILQLRVLGEV
jgi:hypothetical protein